MMVLLIRKTTEIVGWILLAVCACLASDGEPGGELNRALEEIKSTARLIDDRSATAAAVQGQLQVQAEALSAEIRQERRRCSAGSFQQALQINRIRYDLLALQQVTGYLGQLEERLSHLRTAANTLNVYRDQVRDDRLILRALNDLDSSELLRQVQEAVGEYRRQSGAPLLKVPAAHRPPELEMLWNDLVKAH